MPTLIFVGTNIDKSGLSAAFTASVSPNAMINVIKAVVARDLNKAEAIVSLFTISKSQILVA